MSIDWDAVEKENAGGDDYKDYAPEGEYDAKLAGVELITAKTGNTGIRFNLKETADYKFPKYGKTFYNSKNVSWRQHHLKEIFKTLGFTEEKARGLVEQCEAKEDLMQAYLDTLTKLIPKAKPFKVAVFKEYPTDRYSTWDFAAGNVRMNYPKKEEDDESATEGDAIQGSDVTLSDIPF